MTWVIVAGTAIGASIGAGTAAARGQRGWGIGKSALMGGAGGAVTGGLGGMLTGGTAGGLAGGAGGGAASGFGAAPAGVMGPAMANGGFFSTLPGAVQAGTASGSELLSFAGPPMLQQTLGGLNQPSPQQQPLQLPGQTAPAPPPLPMGLGQRTPSPTNYYGEGAAQQDMMYRGGSIPTQSNMDDYIKLLMMLSRR